MFSSLGSGLFFSQFNLFLKGNVKSRWSWGLFYQSLAKSFLPTSNSLSKEPTIGVSASNVIIFSKTSSSGFCLLMIFLLIGSSFYLKITLLILSFVKIMVNASLHFLAKSLAARISFRMSLEGISASCTILP